MPDPNNPSNIPDQPCRWSAVTAGREFDLAKDTVKKRLIAAKQEPGEDGCWSTLQITAAVFGDIHGERVRLTKEQADHVALDNAESRGELINRKSIYNALETLFTSAAQIIISSDLSEQEQDDILNNFASWPIQLTNASTVKTVEAQEPKKAKSKKSKVNDE